MATIISITNHKGGVAKTTTTASLGAALAEKGFKVLVIDLDAQSNLTRSLSSAERKTSVYESIMEGEPLPVEKVSDNLWLVPSSINMASVELQIFSRISREYILSELIEPIAKGYDFILFDCPPLLGLITLNALVASRYVIVPMTAEALPTEGLAMLTNFVDMIKKRPNKSIEILGIVFTRWMGRRLNKDVEASVKKAFGNKVFATRVRENIQVAQAPLAKSSILEYAPESAGATDYRSLCEEVLERIKIKK